ncbi:MAG: 2-keto-4-pentenoate hydratase [Hyphomicrobiaceae bacterium]
MSDARISAIAQQLADARRQGRRAVLNDQPCDLEEAFAVQDEVVRLLGDPVRGWKVIELPTGQVIFAPLLKSGDVPASAPWKVAGPEPAGIELEIAFKLARDVPRDANPEQILECIGAAHVVFELCQSRNANPEDLPRHVTLADCILNNGVCLGATFADWRRKDLKGVAGRLFVDGKPHADGRSGDPIRAMTVLAPAMAARGKALKAGDVVITGSLIGMHWLTGRHQLRGEIDGCGTVEMNLEAA